MMKWVFQTVYMGDQEVARLICIRPTKQNCAHQLTAESVKMPTNLTRNLRHTRVEAFKPKTKSLVEILELFWKLTYWIGMLPDWCCHPIRSRCSRILNGIVSFVCFVVVVTVTAYETFQLIVDFLKLNSIRHSVFSLFYTWLYITGTIFVIVLHLKRQKFLKFFQEWDELEHQPLIRRFWNTDSKPTIFLRINLIMDISTIFIVIALICINPTAPMWLTHRTELVDIFTRPVLFITQAISLVYLTMILNWSVVVPTITAYHMGSALTALQSATENNFAALDSPNKFQRNAIGDRLNQFWHLYEQIRSKANETNYLFGLLHFLLYGMLFVCITFQTGTLLLYRKDLPIHEIITLVFLLIALITYLFMLILTQSQLEQCSRQLAASSALVISKTCHLLTESERISCKLYIINIQQNVLSARPYDLFSVNYSLLLQLFSVVVTYSVILLQSAG